VYQKRAPYKLTIDTLKFQNRGISSAGSFWQTGSDPLGRVVAVSYMCFGPDCSWITHHSYKAELLVCINLDL
jgi:hypothetical protein